jgi:hypothetical protein
MLIVWAVMYPITMMLTYKQMNLHKFQFMCGTINVPSQVKPEKIHNSNSTKLWLWNLGTE